MDILAKLTEVIDKAGDGAYNNYVPTSKHPSSILFTSALCITAILMLGTPLILRLVQRQHQHPPLLLQVAACSNDALVPVCNGGNGSGLCPSCLDYLRDVVWFNNKLQSILLLSVPLICSTNAWDLSELLTMALISRHLVTDAILCT
jgi:hypothetical protein